METAHKTDNEKKEYFDPPEVLEQKCKELADLIKSSKNGIFFTGAGISTACGIPDFRSGINTVLQTGPGAWEKKAVIAKNKSKSVNKAVPSKSKAAIKANMQKAVPSKTHMAIKILVEKRIMGKVVSQNVDGLHRKSGVEPERLSELHGNTNLEICAKCKKNYLRDYRTRTAKSVHDHLTGRSCDNKKCNGKLKDSIINFGENLDEETLENGFKWGKQSQLCIALGSSLRVTPAADIPVETVNKGGKLVIVNLQKTPLDGIAYLRINAMIDDVMIKVMKHLNENIPPFILHRYFSIQTINNRLCLSSIDSNKDPFTLFTKVYLALETKNDNQKGSFQKFEKQPYDLTIDSKQTALKVLLKLSFQKHYEEPDFETDIDVSNMDLTQEQFFRIDYAFKKEWTLYQKSSNGYQLLK